MRKPPRKPLVVGLLALIVFLLVTRSISIFVIQPIGALPDGATLVISRLNAANFVDSADAMCDRGPTGVSLLCRGVIMASVSKNAVVFLRLPYIEWLYLVSTGGKTFEN